MTNPNLSQEKLSLGSLLVIDRVQGCRWTLMIHPIYVYSICEKAYLFMYLSHYINSIHIFGTSKKSFLYWQTSLAKIQMELIRDWNVNKDWKQTENMLISADGMLRYNTISLFLKQFPQKRPYQVQCIPSEKVTYWCNLQVRKRDYSSSIYVPHLIIPLIYAEGYIVFAFPFVLWSVHMFVHSFVHLSRSWNLWQSFSQSWGKVS